MAIPELFGVAINYDTKRRDRLLPIPKNGIFKPTARLMLHKTFESAFCGEQSRIDLSSR